jgi:VanZ family protein
MKLQSVPINYRHWMLIIWLLALVIGSLLPLSGSPGIQHGDKIQHFIGYAVLAILIFRLRTRIGLAFALATIFGVLIEFAQALTPWRSFDPADMLANALGALLGLSVWYWCSRRKID